MLTKPRRPIRTTLDLADARQVKSVKKRLKITDDDLARIVHKIGPSLAAIAKEVALEKTAPAEARLNEPTSLV
ncbi:Protein of unknown function [Bradyrhizobium sp. Ghvi]|nr:Protein of unknown function [Bradyrhizobium sp. Ghvi]